MDSGKRYRPRVLLATAWLSVFCVAGADAARIQEVRTGETDQRTRIVIESDRPIRFTLYAVRYPDRFLLDLEGVTSSGPLPGIDSLIADDHESIRSIRTLVPAAGILTLELVLRARLEPQVFALEPSDGRGHRLVLDIYAPGVQEALLARQAKQPVQEHARRPAPASPSPPPGATPRPASLSPQTLAERAPSTAPRRQYEAVSAPVPAALDASEATLDQPTHVEEAWVAVSLNGQAASDTVLALRRGDGRWLLASEDLQRWRLRAPAGAAVEHQGVAYQLLDGYRGLSYRLDERSQVLHIEAGPGLFAGTLLGARTPGFEAPPPAPAGGVINYDLLASGSDGEEDLGATLEVLGFGPWGVVESSFVGRDLLDARDVVRLETTWTRDLPSRMASIRVGDTVTGGGSVGRPVRMGGIQWATNFATQPGFIRFPLPGIAGEAALPSIIELYVNNALRSRHEVPTGPFSIDQLPVVTGEGLAQLVVRDMLGRERIISQAFYVSPRLLQPGLDEYSYELGAIREDFGLRSTAYGRVALVGTHRRGITERLTAELHGEVLSDQQMLGVGAALLWPDVGVLSVSAAASEGQQGRGTLLGVGFERQGRTLGLGVSGEHASRHYTQLGFAVDGIAPRLTARAFASLNLDAAGSLALSYALQDRRIGADLESASLNYAVRVGTFGFLNVIATRVLGEEADTIIGVNLAIPLDERRHASVSLTQQDDQHRSQWLLQRNVPVGSGHGYRLLVEEGAIDRVEAGARVHTDSAAYLFELSRLEDTTGWRASTQGSIAWIGGTVHAARQISEGFALVQLPGFPGVGVYADNQLVAHTDAEGNALLPAMRAYQNNRVRIDQAGLPLDAEVGTLELVAVPWYRSGVLLKFPVVRARGVVLELVLEDGSFVPPGAVARIEGGQETHPVGYDGLLYLTDVDTGDRIVVEWSRMTCGLALHIPASNEPLPDLGPQVCRVEP